MTADLTYLVAGASLLLAVFLPELLDRWAVSAPMVLVSVGLVIGLTPLPDGLPLDPNENRAVVEHVSEIVVIVALMGVGLALDRPLRWRDRESRRTWRTTWRMLGIAMPLSITGVGLLGWSVGLPVAAAILLGAVLAPTDPVLASDVQVAGPQTVGGDAGHAGRTGTDERSQQHEPSGQGEQEHEVDERDELRFTLTSEAGLNDGLAFPFVYLAVLVAGGLTAVTSLEWVGWYLVGKTVLGLVLGHLVGRVLAWAAFRAPSRSLRVAERGESLMALAALVAAYGVAEVAHGYGFLAVFACALTFRSAERSHDYHAAMHEVAERLERLLTLGVLLVLGIAVSRGLLDHLDWRGVLVAALLIGVVRPLSGRVALVGRTIPLTPGQRWAAAFFGVRGIGSVYYLAYAGGEAPGLATDWMWSTVAFTVVLSVLVHGVLATPVMRRVGERA